MISYCGLNCETCECYIATQADDDSKRAEVARKWSGMFKSDIRADQINCHGCKSDGQRFFFSENHCEIRRCCMKTAVEHCAACEFYMCGTLTEFVKMSPRAGRALDALRDKK